MRIAIIGTRGIPANYGGFETFAEELSVRLVRMGHEVTVYCRSKYAKANLKEYKGVKLVILPTINNKYLDTVVHTFLSSLHLLFHRKDAAYYCNAVNSVFMILPRMAGIKTVINVDGLEWKRKKWNCIAKTVYKISEKISTILSNRIISDSGGIKKYYKDKFGVTTELISYGAYVDIAPETCEVLDKLNLKRKKYMLYLSRLEPENNAHVVVKAFTKVKTDMPLVMVGDAPYGGEYIRNLKSTRDKRIIFPGSIYGRDYAELISNTYVYIHGNEVGGTNPALLQAMGAGNCVIANGVSFNREVVGDAGICFEPGDTEDLKEKIEYALANPEEVEKLRIKAKERIKKYYNWDDVADKTEKLLASIVRGAWDRRHV